MYYYVMEEYKVANQLLQEDIYVRFLSLPFLFYSSPFQWLYTYSIVDFEE